MCQKCVDAVAEYFPDVRDRDYGDFLMCATCFPFGDGDMVAKQVRELAERGAKTCADAIRMASTDTEEAMADAAHNDGLRER